MARSDNTLGPVDLNSDVPPWYRHLVAKSGTKLGLVDLSSDISLVEASSDQEWYYISQLDIWSAFGSGLPLVRCTLLK